jgi:hypothetical protein
MATFYIDGEASVNGSGTYASPYNATPTITSNNTYLYAASRTLNGGAGTAISVSAGASGVTIGAYEFATGTRLHGGSSKARITTTSGQFTVRVNTNAHNCTIEMLDVDNPSGVSQAHGIYIGNSSALVANGCTVRRCKVRDISGTGTSNGIAFRGSDFTAYENEIYNIPVDGIFGYGPRAKIYRNTIYDVDQLDTTGDCIQVAGDATLDCSDVYIARNVLTNPNGNKQCLIVQDTTGGSSGGCISENTCVIASGASNQAIYTETVGIRVERNRITGGYHGIFSAGADAEILGNLVLDSGYSGITQKTGVTGAYIDGNTVAGAPTYGIYCGDDTTANARNNVLYECGTGLAKHGTATEDYNAYWLCTTDQANVAGTPAWGANNITTDPLLTSTYRPRAGSPLLGAGTHLGYTRDIERKQRPNPPSIGAYDTATLRTP